MTWSCDLVYQKYHKVNAINLLKKECVLANTNPSNISIQDRAHKDEKDVRRSANIQELVSLKENNRQLKHELEKTQDLLHLEQSTHRNDLDKVIIVNNSRIVNTKDEWHQKSKTNLFCGVAPLSVTLNLNSIKSTSPLSSPWEM